jgi:hypothetical protein
MKNYMKQILRTPIQSALIIVLVMIVTVMLVAGGNLWVFSDRLSKAYEDDFITIGTVTQKPDTVQERKIWDAEKGDYLLYKDPVYNRYAAEEDLAFEEMTYLVEPEKRAYWGSYAPEYLHIIEEWDLNNSYGYIVAEFTPLEDCIPNESVKIKITKIWGGYTALENTVVWFCEHYNRYPEELKAGTIYVGAISEGEWIHGKHWEESGNQDLNLEFCPELISITLCTSKGEKIEDPLEMQGIYEATDGFYETEEGRRLLEVADQVFYMHEMQPVVGTNSTDLLLPFYEGSAWVYEGRYPSQEEYAQGSQVCLAPRIFAENNGLSVGDQIMTRLCYANYADEIDRNFGLQGGGIAFNPIGLDGKLFQPFEEKAYTIVGLYDYTQTVEGIGRDELIVPLNSIHNKTENIVEYGAMTDENTSFRLENGTVADFLEISAKYSVDDLIFTFYDRGYSALKEGIQNLKNMSAALLIMGLIAAVILTLQISHIYITKQKKRLAIERLLGMTGKRCRNICLLGILILLLLGAIPGVAAGMAVSEQVNIEDMGQDDFNRKYSNLGLSAQTEVDLSGQSQGDLTVSCMMGGMVIVLGVGISGVKVRSILKGEPLYLVDDGMAGK